MITGSVNDGRPTITGLLFIPRLDLRGYVSFLVDTGADGTVVHPEDMDLLGIIPARHFLDSSAIRSSGLGGMVMLRPEPCELFL